MRKLEYVEINYDFGGKGLNIICHYEGYLTRIHPYSWRAYKLYIRRYQAYYCSCWPIAPQYALDNQPSTILAFS